MSDPTTARAVRFEHLAERPVHVRFDQPAASSDGGALLLKAVDERLGLTRRLAACLRDDRDPSRVVHSTEDLVRQRVFGIACGYADANDAARLIDDPIQRLLLGRDPIEGAPIASQPTLSRFENRFEARSLLAMGEALAEHVIERHHRRLGGRARRITIDLDPTDDQTHGAQQLTAFNAHYDGYCYLPVAGFLSFDDEPEQYLFCFVLRPGDVGAAYGARPILERLVGKLRAAFGRRTALRVRLDGGYATPDLFDFLDDAGLEYAIGMPTNGSLRAHAEALMAGVRERSEASGQGEQAYADVAYSAARWDTARRAVIKAEVVVHSDRPARDNARFLVTNIDRTARFVYERIYCARAHVENRIKELLHGLAIDRSSCSRFLANQFRGLLTATAYVLYQELRLAAAGTSLEGAQVTTLRERLIKLGAWVERSTRRIAMHLPDSAPWRGEWIRIARVLGAVPG